MTSTLTNKMYKPNGTVAVNPRLERKQCNFIFSKYLDQPEFIEDYIQHRKLTQENAKLKFITKAQQNDGFEAEEYTDAQLEIMLENTYGPFNKSAVRYKQLFETYKRSKLEELESWKLEAKKFKDKNLDPDNLLPGLLCNPDLYDTEEEKNECFNDNIPINPYLLNDELLELPFIKIQKNEILLAALRKFQSKSFTINPLESKPPINWLLLNHARPLDLFVEKQLNEEMLTTEDEKICLKRYQLTPFGNNCAWMNFSTNAVLFPPMYWETFEIEQVERIIWHQIQILLSINNGRLKIDDIANEYYVVYNIGLTSILTHWKELEIDVDNLEPFVSRMCSIFNNGNIFICSKTREFRPETKQFIYDKYLIRRTMNNKNDPLIAEIMEDAANNDLTIATSTLTSISNPPLSAINEPESSQRVITQDEKELIIAKTTKLINELQHFPIAGIPFQFIQWGEEPEIISDYVQDDSYLRCVPKWIVSPSQIFMNLYQSWNELESFQDYLQERVGTFLQDISMRRLGTPQISLLIPGLNILAYCHAAPEDKLEWYRAIIESVVINPLKIIVQLIDFGAYVAIDDILHLFYLERELLMNFPVQSIECRLSFGEAYDGIIPKWKPGASSYLVELFHNRCLGVNFKERIENGNSNDKRIWKNKYVWLVSVNVLVEGTPGFHTTLQSETDVDNPFLQESVSIELDRRAARKKKSKVATISDQARFEGHISYIKSHGEYLCKVDKYDISQEVQRFMIEPLDTDTDTRHEGDI